MDIYEELTARYPALEYCVAEIRSAADIIWKTYENHGKLLVCGNGGSGADAEHIVGELMKEFYIKRPLKSAEQELLKSIDPDGAVLAQHLQGALPAITLTSNIALTTAYSNDAVPELVFAQQVWGYGCLGDALLAISTSGSSKNVRNAIIAARAKGMTVIGLTGSRRGTIDSLCNLCIKVPSSITYQVQEYHLPVYHVLCRYVEEKMFAEHECPE